MASYFRTELQDLFVETLLIDLEVRVLGNIIQIYFYRTTICETNLMLLKACSCMRGGSRPLFFSQKRLSELLTPTTAL